MECGDGVNIDPEECDDGNASDNNRCDVDCKVESWYSCEALKPDGYTKTRITTPPKISIEVTSENGIILTFRKPLSIGTNVALIILICSILLAGTLSYTSFIGIGGRNDSLFCNDHDGSIYPDSLPEPTHEQKKKTLENLIFKIYY